MSKVTESRTEKFYALRVIYEERQMWLCESEGCNYYTDNILNGDLIRVYPHESDRPDKAFSFDTWDIDEEVQYIPIEIRTEITIGSKDD